MKRIGGPPLSGLCTAFLAWWAEWRFNAWQRRAGRRAEREAARLDLPPALVRARSAALLLIAAICMATTVSALAESYRNLLKWALHHGVSPAFAWAWPLTVDAFVVIPELVLFLAMVDHWLGWGKAWPWLVIAAGLSASVAGNIGSLGTSPTWPDRFTAAASPTAAFVGLTLALAVLKRVVIAARAAAPALVADVGDIPATARDIIARAVSANITDTGTLAVLSGVSERHVQRLKNGSQQRAQGHGAPAATSATQHRHRAAQPRLTATGGRP